MIFINKLSPKAMLTFKGTTYHANDYKINTGKDKELQEFLSKHNLWKEYKGPAKEEAPPTGDSKPDDGVDVSKMNRAELVQYCIDNKIEIDADMTVSAIITEITMQSKELQE